MNLKDFKNLIYGISTKMDGSMKLLTAENDANSDNRLHFFAGLGIGMDRVVSARLAHGGKVKNVDRSYGGRILDNIDGLATQEPDLILAITIADCLPVYFYNPDDHAIGICHAGWRGIQQGIIANTCQALKEDFGAKAEETIVFVGPHIRSCHFEVKKDVWTHFESIPEAVIVRDGKRYLDLSKVVKNILLNNGYREENIGISPECTQCQPQKYFSFRRDKPEVIEAMVAYIGLKKAAF